MTTWAVTASALILAALGLVLLFAGEEAAAEVFRLSDVHPLAPLLGGALLGFATMNWVARRSLLGGIYGRAIVVGNQWHFIVGALVLLKQCVGVGGTWLLYALTTVYVIGASLFSYLVFGPGRRAQR